MSGKNKKQDEKFKKKQNEAKLNKFSYHFYALLSLFIAKIFFGLKVDRRDIKDKKGPFLVLGNHTAWLDAFYFAGCTYPKPLTAVVASNIFYRKFLRKIFGNYGVIPKKQFSTDFTCIKLIKKYLDNGTSVMLFPEGRITVDGTTGYIAPSIGKLIKWLNYPVVKGITVGSYITRPKWGNNRPGYVTLTMTELLSKDDIEKMSADEIANFVIENMQYNDNRAFVERGSKLWGLNMAKGMEKILYKCPNCGKEFLNVSKRKHLTCTNCGNTVVYGHDAKIHPYTEKDKYFEYIDEWYEYERECVREEVRDENFKLVENVNLLLNNESLKRFTPSGNGTLTISKDTISYQGNMNGEKCNLSFAIKNHPTVAYKIAQNIEIAEDDNIYRFVFEHGVLSTKAVLVIEELYKLLQEK